MAWPGIVPGLCRSISGDVFRDVARPLCPKAMHENQNQDSARWGRPLRKRSRGPKSQPAPNEPAFVGPVDPEMAHEILRIAFV